jgi:hypothetical protein
MIRRVRDELGISADLLVGRPEKNRRKPADFGKFERGSINSNRQSAVR